MSPPFRGIGPYIVSKDLTEGRHGPRYLALHASRHTSHTLHLVGRTVGIGGGDVRIFSQAVARMEELDDPHILRVDSYGTDPDQGPWIATDYTGDADGLVTLDRLLRLKGGAFVLEESKRAIEHMLMASVHAHTQAARIRGGSRPQAHGPLAMDEVQVDRSGSLVIEFYGLMNQLRPSLGVLDAERDEVRSIVRIGYQLVTGLLPHTPVIPVEDVIEGIDPTWTDFFATGMALDGGAGFATAAHALSACRACRVAGAGAGGPISAVVRTLLSPRPKRR